MARLTNTPQQLVNFDLERRKSYSFCLIVSNADGSPVDLTGGTVTFIAKRKEFDSDLYDSTNMIVNAKASMLDPARGIALFDFQAADLDEPPGNYYYTIVYRTSSGFSVTITKGELNIFANTDSSSMLYRYTPGATTTAALEVTMRGGDVLNVVTNTMNMAHARPDIIGMGSPVVPASMDASIAAKVAIAAVGTLFISLDGNGQGYYAWRKRSTGAWVPVETDLVTWSTLAGKPTAFQPVAHKHPLSDLLTGSGASAATYLRGDGAWVAPTLGWHEVTGRPAVFPPANHTHVQGDVTGLTAALDNKSSIFHAHHYTDIGGLTAQLAGRALFDHTHGIEQVTGLQLALSNRSMIGHTHPQSEIQGLSGALASKAHAGHTHELRDMQDAMIVAPAEGQVLTYLDGIWRNMVPSGGGGGTADWSTISNKPGTFPSDPHTHTAAQISDSTPVGRSLLKAATTGDARTVISAAPLSHSHNLIDINEVSTIGTELVKASTKALARTVIDAAAISHTHNLSSMLDASIAAPADGQVLTWDAATNRWKNKAATGGGSSPVNLADLADVSGTPGFGDVLFFNGSEWVPIDDSAHTHTPDQLNIYGDASEGRFLRADWSWAEVPASGGGGGTIVGPGRPDLAGSTNGAIQGFEPVGTLYASTDGSGTGAWLWIKTSVQWELVRGDTGWRALPRPAVMWSNFGNFWVRRINNQLHVRQHGWPRREDNTDVATYCWTLPSGWFNASEDFGQTSIRGGYPASPGFEYAFVLRVNGDIYMHGRAGSNGSIADGISPLTETWPTTLPGSAI